MVSDDWMGCSTCGRGWADGCSPRSRGVGVPSLSIDRMAVGARDHQKHADRYLRTQCHPGTGDALAGAHTPKVRQWRCGEPSAAHGDPGDVAEDAEPPQHAFVVIVSRIEELEQRAETESRQRQTHQREIA